MHYNKVVFTIECADDMKQICRELLASDAGEAGFESFVETEEGIDGYIQQDVFAREAVDALVSGFPLDNVLDNVSISYTVSAVADENWNREWESAGFAPIDIDGKIIVFDAKRTIPNADHEVSIGIDAENAFGTGTHETTRLVLSQLLSLPVAGKRVLDCGCGTGILSVAASKLGAEEVVAYDVDEWSVRNCEHNAHINGVTNVTVMEGDASVLSHISGVFDIVVANINRNILLADMAAFKEVMAEDATLIVSGFYVDDVPMLLDKAWNMGLSEYARKEENNWCMLALR